MIISDDFGQQSGTNLFHSFSEFNIISEQSATFTGPSEITNVISRVTGGNPSTIDGSLGCDIEGANLFLLNPFGIMFGPSASLDVSGSFYASTADSLLFSDGSEFHANLGKNSVLTVASPEAFGFLSESPASITMDGSSLQGAGSGGTAIGLVGGNLTIGGENGAEIWAGDKVQLLGVGGPGVVDIADPAIPLDPEGVTGNVTVTNADISAYDYSPGSVVIRGGQLQVNNSWVYSYSLSNDSANLPAIDIEGESIELNEGSFIYSYTDGIGEGGDIKLKSRNISLSDSSEVWSVSNNSGAGGDIYIDVDEIYLNDNAQISSSSWAGGEGGGIHINTSEALTMVGTASIKTTATDAGDSGSIAIQSHYVILGEDANISATSIESGECGQVSIKANEALFMTDNSRVGTLVDVQGFGGDVLIESDTVHLSDASSIDTASLDSGQAGFIDVQANDSITLSGNSLIGTSAFGTGIGGAIYLSSRSLLIADTASVHTNSSGTGSGGSIGIHISGDMTINDDASIKSLSGGTGDGGDISIRSKNMQMNASTEISTTSTAEGACGGITIHTDESLLVGGQVEGEDFSQVSSWASGIAGAGEISVTSESLDIQNGGSITSISNGQSDSRIIDIQTDLLVLSENSEIFSLSLGGSGAAPISIFTNGLSMKNNAIIKMSSRNDSQGKDISLNTHSLTMEGYASISNEASGGAAGGDINIMSSGNISMVDDASVIANTTGSGAGGDISISSNTISFEDYSLLWVSSNNTGTCGNIHIDALESIEIHDEGDILSYTSGSSGAGTITIYAPILELINGGTVGSLSGGEGPSGDIIINASNIFMDFGAMNSGGVSGDSANIFIRTENLQAYNNSLISTGTIAEGQGGNIRIIADGIIFDESDISSGTTGSGIAGEVMIETDEMTLQNGALIESGTIELEDNPTGGGGDGGSIIISAGDLTIGGRSDIIASTISTYTNNSGNAGNVSIDLSGELNLLDGGGITSETEGTGDAGDIDLSAHIIRMVGGDWANLTKADTEDFESAVISSSSTTETSGEGGHIRLHDIDLLSMNGAAKISASTMSDQNAGTINIEAREININGAVIAAATAGTGDGGRIQINSDTMSIAGGNGISCETAGSGSAGDLSITSESLFINGEGNLNTGIYADSTQSGDAGSMILDISHIRLINGAEISTAIAQQGQGGNITLVTDGLDILSGSSISSAAAGIGNGGILDVQGSGIVRLDNGRITTDAGDGQGGDIFLSADSLTLLNGSEISSNSEGSGDAGDIGLKILADLLSRQSDISTSALLADGGNITISAGGIARFISSDVKASVGGGADTIGGNINMEAPFMVLDNSRVLANAFEGHGGAISIRSKTFLSDPESVVDASSQSGIDGWVTIVSPFGNPDGGLKPLKGKLPGHDKLLKETCEARVKGGDYGSFIVKGRDALPVEPGSYQMSPPML